MRAYLRMPELFAFYLDHPLHALPDAAAGAPPHRRRAWPAIRHRLPTICWRSLWTPDRRRCSAPSMKPFVTITVCAPAAPTNCQTIDHILVDTGSSGLRIISSALSSALALSQQTDAGGDAVAECTNVFRRLQLGADKIGQPANCR